MAKKLLTTEETQVARDQVKAKLVTLREEYVKGITLIIWLLGDLSKSKVQLQQLAEYYSSFKGSEPAKDVAAILAPALEEIDHGIKKASATLKEFRITYNNIEKDLNAFDGSGILNRIKQNFKTDNYFAPKYNKYKIKGIEPLHSNLFTIQEVAKKIFSPSKHVYAQFEQGSAMHLMKRAKTILYNKFLKASSELGDLYKDKTKNTESLKLKTSNSSSVRPKKYREQDIKVINQNITKKEEDIKKLAARFTEVNQDISYYLSQSLWRHPEDYYIKKYSAAKWQKLPKVERELSFARFASEALAKSKIEINKNNIAINNIRGQDLDISSTSAQASPGQIDTNDIEANMEVGKKLQAASATPLAVKPGQETEL